MRGKSLRSEQAEHLISPKTRLIEITFLMRGASATVGAPSCLQALERVLASTCAFAKIDLLLVGE